VLDFFKIVSNNAIKGGFKQAGVDYRNNGRDSFMRAYINDGKLDNLTGADAMTLCNSDRPEDIKKMSEYCQQDTDTVMKALQKDGYNLMRIIKNVADILRADDPEGQGFLRTANAGNVNNWWSTKLDNDPYFEMPDPASWIMIDNFNEKERIKKEKEKSAKSKKGKGESQYGGGMVFTPVPGIYVNASSSDFNSMYPTIIDIFNLDALTVMCDCCKVISTLPLILKIMCT
jgi:hypothetical protein